VWIQGKEVELGRCGRRPVGALTSHFRRCPTKTLGLREDDLGGRRTAMFTIFLGALCLPSSCMFVPFLNLPGPLDVLRLAYYSILRSLLSFTRRLFAFGSPCSPFASCVQGPLVPAVYVRDPMSEISKAADQAEQARQADPAGSGVRSCNECLIR
jgi:hypothetical protein